MCINYTVNPFAVHVSILCVYSILFYGVATVYQFIQLCVCCVSIVCLLCVCCVYWCAAPDGVVLGPNVTSLSSTAVSIHWSLPMLQNRHGRILSYSWSHERLLQANVSSRTSAFSGLSLSRTLTAHNLTAGSLYQFSISPCNAFGCGTRLLYNISTHEQRTFILATLYAL